MSSNHSKLYESHHAGIEGQRQMVIGNVFSKPDTARTISCCFTIALFVQNITLLLCISDPVISLLAYQHYDVYAWVDYNWKSGRMQQAALILYANDVTRPEKVPIRSYTMTDYFFCRIIITA